MPAMNMLVRIYGDSLGLPRPSESVSCGETYGEQFKSQLERAGNRVALYNRSVGGASLRDLRRAWERDKPYFAASCEVLVIQCGVVDCAPRPVDRTTRGIVSRLPPVARQPIVDFLHRKRAAILSYGFLFRITEPAAFESLYGRWLAEAAALATVVFALNIAPTRPQTESHSPGFARSIEMYNEIISRSVQRVSRNVFAVDVYSAIKSEPGGTDRYISADGHHISPAGHRLYADLLFSHAQRVLSGSDQTNECAEKAIRPLTGGLKSENRGMESVL